jgi:hypothetical protein
LTIFSPGLFIVFLIVHSSVVTMSNKHSLSKSHYLDPQALTSDRMHPNQTKLKKSYRTFIQQAPRSPVCRVF